MHVKEFAEHVSRLAEEIGCDGGTRIGSHKIPSSVEVWVDGADDDADYEIASLEPYMLPGCGCWAGIIIRVRKVTPNVLDHRLDASNACGQSGGSDGSA